LGLCDVSHGLPLSLHPCNAFALILGLSLGPHRYNPFVLISGFLLAHNLATFLPWLETQG